MEEAPKKRRGRPAKAKPAAQADLGLTPPPTTSGDEAKPIRRRATRAKKAATPPDYDSVAIPEAPKPTPSGPSVMLPGTRAHAYDYSPGGRRGSSEAPKREFSSQDDDYSPRRDARPKPETDVPESFSASPDDAPPSAGRPGREESLREGGDNSPYDSQRTQQDEKAASHFAPRGDNGNGRQPFRKDGNFQKGGYNQNYGKKFNQNFNQNYNKNFNKKFKDKKFQKFQKFQGGQGNFSKNGGFGGQWKPSPTAQFDSDTSVFSPGGLPSWEILRNTVELDRLAEENASQGDIVSFNELYALTLPELEETAREAGVTVPATPTRRQLLRDVLDIHWQAKRPIHLSGVLEVLSDGDGVLVYAVDNYRLKSQSAYMPAALIRRYGLQRGHIVDATIQPPRVGESCPCVIKVREVMGLPPEQIAHITPFTELTPYYPLERLMLETGPEVGWDNISMRVVDLLTPIGLGQRGLIVAPPRTGKTILLQGIANAIATNRPDTHLIVLLIDERPEEVTDFRRQVKGEVISSTFDEDANSHTHCAEMVIEKARRMVEVGKHVVILLDSITRLARAYNTLMPNSGKILSGGVEANALQKPKRFFGSARNIEGGGSLTIMGTALVDTGSKMDEVIFEEFKGTGNMELHLDRALVDKRIFPALSMDKSGTRKEELLYHPEELLKIYSLRRAMKGVPSPDAMEMLIQRVKKTKTNAEFLMTLNR